MLRPPLPVADHHPPKARALRGVKSIHSPPKHTMQRLATVPPEPVAKLPIYPDFYRFRPSVSEKSGQIPSPRPRVVFRFSFPSPAWKQPAPAVDRGAPRGQIHSLPFRFSTLSYGPQKLAFSFPSASRLHPHFTTLPCPTPWFGMRGPPTPPLLFLAPAIPFLPARPFPVRPHRFPVKRHWAASGPPWRRYNGRRGNIGVPKPTAYTQPPAPPWPTFLWPLPAPGRIRLVTVFPYFLPPLPPFVALPVLLPYSPLPCLVLPPSPLHPLPFTFLLLPRSLPTPPPSPALFPSLPVLPSSFISLFSCVSLYFLLLFAPCLAL